MRIPQIIGAWLILCFIYSTTAGLVLFTGLLVRRFLSPNAASLPIWILVQITLLVGVLGATPGLITNIKKYRRER